MPEEISENKNVFDEAYFSWDAPEYIHHSRGFVWQVIVTTLWLALIAYAVFSSAWSFAVALLVFGGVYQLVHHESPKRMTVKISKHGIKIGESEIPFQHIQTFWIHHVPPHVKSLKIRLHRRWTPELAISLEDQNSAEIREYLASQVPEWEGREEHLHEIFIRAFKL